MAPPRGWRAVLAFLLIAFGWSWSVWAVGLAIGIEGSRSMQIIGAWGPLVAAGVVTFAVGGDVVDWARQLIPKRSVRYRWYALAFLAPLALTQTGPTIGWILGEPVQVIDPIDVLFTFVLTLFLAGALEEFGWRGFLQPRLQERWSALTGAVVVGIIWALWHLPLVFGGAGAGYESGEFVTLLIGLPLFSIVMAWMYNSTRGGLLFVMLFHATINATPILTAEAMTPLMGIGEVLAVLGIPLLIVLFYGREYLANARPQPPIPGSP